MKDGKFNFIFTIIDSFWNYFYFRLPYKEHRRRVIFQGAPTLQSHDKVRNLVIQWQSPQANIKKSKSMNLIDVLILLFFVN